jgi:hypothetical protein
MTRMQTPSLPKAVLRQVRLPGAPADGRPGVEEAMRERLTRGAGVSKPGMIPLWLLGLG